MWSEIYAWKHSCVFWHNGKHLFPLLPKTQTCVSVQLADRTLETNQEAENKNLFKLKRTENCVCKLKFNKLFLRCFWDLVPSVTHCQVTPLKVGSQSWLLWSGRQLHPITSIERVHEGAMFLYESFRLPHALKAEANPGGYSVIKVCIRGT